MTIINLDGVRIKLQPPDLDGDGIRGEVETVERRMGSNDIQPVIQSTELGESLRELNDDEIEGDTRMSGIDMRARLHPVEVSSILALDALVALRFLPTRCLAFSRQKKRLSVSIQGKGREDIVNIVSGKREQDVKMAGGGFGSSVKSFFSRGGGE